MRKAAALAVAAAGVAVFVGAALAGPVDEAGAQAVQVDYQVGDITVVGVLARNPSCSITRNFRNDGPVPLQVVARAEWDGHAAVFPTAGDSQYTEPTVLEPGGQVTAVWNGVDRDQPTLSAGPVRLLLESRFVDGSGSFAARVEFVDACTPDVSPTVPSVPTVESTVPVTVPDTVAVPVPDTTSPPPDTVVSGPAPSTTAPGVEVLTQEVRRAELPHTGSSTPELVALGVALLLTGASIVARPGRKLTHGDES